MNEQPVKVELLGCPFCGGDELSYGWNYAGIQWAQVECHNDACQAHVFAETEAEAVAAWNTRTPVSTPPDEVERAGFAPCPTCRQYSHSIGEDKLADAFKHFQSMHAHPARGHPMGYNFDETTRDAAQALMSAALRAAPIPERAGEMREAVAETYRGWTIRQGRWPEPAWMATGPNYDASYEGPEDGWVASSESAFATTRAELIGEIDIWFEERGHE